MGCPITNAFSKCFCVGGMICQFCIQLIIVVTVIVFGALIARRPKKTIDIQIALYRPFNWKIEPVSMEKEIRNTRIMGLALLIAGVAALAYVLLF